MKEESAIFLASCSHTVEFFRAITGSSQRALEKKRDFVYSTKVYPPISLATLFERPYCTLLFDKCLVDDFALLQLKAALNDSFIPDLEKRAFIGGRSLNNYTSDLRRGLLRGRDKPAFRRTLSYFIGRLEQESLLESVDTTSLLVKYQKFLRLIFGPSKLTDSHYSDDGRWKQMKLWSTLLSAYELQTPIHEELSGGPVIVSRLGEVNPILAMGLFLAESKPDLRDLGGKRGRRRVNEFEMKNISQEVLARTSSAYVKTVISQKMGLGLRPLRTKMDVDRFLSLRYDPRVSAFRNKVQELAHRLPNNAPISETETAIEQLVADEYNKVPLDKLPLNRGRSVNEFIIPAITAGTFGALGTATGGILGGALAAATGVVIEKLAEEFYSWLNTHSFSWYLFVQNSTTFP